MVRRFRGHSRRDRQAGFTLVEIAIVMVIIGLLIGGILKGQELIKNAKIKRLMKQVDELRVAVTSYQDRYGFLPGDDSAANTRPNGAGLTNGNGNGQISTAEAPDMFMHLAASGLISGTYTTAPASYPRNPFGGAYHVQWATISGKQTHWFYTTMIPGEIGTIIDTSHDDGVNTTGSIRASAAYTTGNNVTMYIEF
ncbi:MAG: prepilin-type cleavage/methylation domain-containing protein [Deltaproteobacteria bacterium]|nr:MAG: prepilin-type cleavage/methylation domain-containing protein [Deltaproteobacteria bacterium]